ncbi:DUF6364 family protein [Parabacteroides sp. PF5-6]|uniref:DUF6364 family protein n=1 Tax=Parabacteroides sp. PF5-6 TaxID=1742403 RepID=UPI002406FFDE|nr:DUF6364 family protein [Parabacteroides sp. PF5-6]MDF9830989.1 hypothetical protein [Parabacteroides sp. PF5-6]
MYTKLTLNVNRSIVEEAKVYAKRHHVSLSNLIENYLGSLTKEPQRRVEVSELVESLTGIIPEPQDDRKEYRDYLDQKYN